MPDEKPGASRRNVVFTAVVAVSVLGYAGARTFEPRATQAQDPSHAAARGNPSNIFYDLPELLLDIRAPGSSRALLKLRLTVELETERDISLVQRASPHILDAFITTLRSMPLDDLEGRGLQRMQRELLEIVRTRSAPAKIRGVLFKEMMVSDRAGADVGADVGANTGAA
jgi:flagellar basal body-associated protein FliL